MEFKRASPCVRRQVNVASHRRARTHTHAAVASRLYVARVCVDARERVYVHASGVARLPARPWATATTKRTKVMRRRGHVQPS